MNHDATTETRLLQSALLADPEAVARWLLYTSDGTYVCVLRKSGKGKPAWHDHDDKRGWADSRGDAVKMPMSKSSEATRRKERRCGRGNT